MTENEKALYDAISKGDKDRTQERIQDFIRNDMDLHFAVTELGPTILGAAAATANMEIFLTVFRSTNWTVEERQAAIFYTVDHIVDNELARGAFEPLFNMLEPQQHMAVHGIVGACA